jgi:hypothetical protein
MSIDPSYVAVVLSCALVNLLILAAWGLALLLPRQWQDRLLDLFSRVPWHQMPER